MKRPTSFCTQGLPLQQSSAEAQSPSGSTHSPGMVLHRGTSKLSATQALEPSQSSRLVPQHFWPLGALKEPSQAAVPSSGLPQMAPSGLQAPTLQRPTSSSSLTRTHWASPAPGTVESGFPPQQSLESRHSSPSVRQPVGG